MLVTAQTGIKQEFTAPPPDFLKNVNETDPQIAVFPEANYVAAVIRLRAALHRPARAAKFSELISTPDPRPLNP